MRKKDWILTIDKVYRNKYVSVIRLSAKRVQMFGTTARIRATPKK